MIEDLVPLKLPPGLSANGTKYQNAGRWNDGNCVRFHAGRIMPIGGWQPIVPTGVVPSGTPEAAISWLLSDGTPITAFGTANGLYVLDDNNVVYNITPASIPAAPYNWQLSTFGSYLIAVNSLLGDQDLSLVNTYVWMGATGTPAAAAWTGAVGPFGAYAAFATPERFLVVLRGKDPTGEPARGGVGTLYSERRVYWASQESLTGFISTDTNTGGDFDLTTEGRLICGAASRGQSLLWTDIDLWTMNYIGGDLIYSFQNAGRGCGIVSKRAFVVLDKGAFWMGRSNFFSYDGFVRHVPCEVADAVFGNFNQQFAQTVWALPNPQYNEVTWFYPSLGSTTPDRYVTYNHEENHWTYGTVARVAGFPLRFRHDIVNPPVPYMWGADGTMYAHETGDERNTLAFLTSGPLELGAGDRLARIQGIVPDDKTVGDVQLRLFGAMSPDDLEMVYGPFPLSQTTPLRATARQVRVRLEEASATSWRVGTIRLAVRAAERRGASTSATRDLVPVSIEVIPASVTLVNAEHYTFAYIVRNAEGQALDVKPDSWTTSDPTAFTVDANGTVTVLKAPATVSVQAHITSLGISSNLASISSAPSTPVSISIPASVQAELNGSTPVTATVKDARGIILTDQVVTWDSDATAHVTIGASTGIASGVGAIGSTANLHAHIAAHSLNSGACVASVVQTYVIHTFPVGTNQLVVTTGGVIDEMLVVAGGGSGGSVDGTGVIAGGGGAGELRHEVAVPITPGTYGLNVGAGGVRPFADHTYPGGVLAAMTGTDGGDTTFDLLNVRCKGGGGGGARIADTSPAGFNRNGRNGGSGGGGGSCGDGSQGSAGISTINYPLPDVPPDPGLGYGGGGGSNSSVGTGGGGGGANGPGDGSGNAGPGIGYSINVVDPSMVAIYARGGSSINGVPASPDGNGGSGCGGNAGGNALNAQGGNGGSGTVTLKYRQISGIVATGGTRIVAVQTTP